MKKHMEQYQHDLMEKNNQRLAQGKKERKADKNYVYINVGELVNQFFQKSEAAKSLLRSNEPTEDFYMFILMIANMQHQENIKHERRKAQGKEKKRVKLLDIGYSMLLSALKNVISSVQDSSKRSSKIDENVILGALRTQELELEDIE